MVGFGYYGKQYCIGIVVKSGKERCRIQKTSLAFDTILLLIILISYFNILIAYGCMIDLFGEAR